MKIIHNFLIVLSAGRMNIVYLEHLYADEVMPNIGGRAFDDAAESGAKLIAVNRLAQEALASKRTSANDAMTHQNDLHLLRRGFVIESPFA